MKKWEFPFRILCLAAVLAGLSIQAFAGVSRAVQDQYRKQYENKAMFLKIPIYAEKQMIYITGQSFRIDRGAGSPRYRVGDQLRILSIDFGGDEIKFRMGGIATAGFVDLGFKFDSSLEDSFPNRDVFDRALQATLTEGLKYTDIDDAKEEFVREQFDRSVREISGSASVSREAVLKTIAPRLPAYQDAQRDIEGLRSRLQTVADQLTNSQTEHRKLEAETRAQKTEIARLTRENAALQEKLDNYTLQVTRLGEEVRDAKGSAQGYQRELANIQRSLNLRVDSGRDLAAQITDLGQAMKKLQNDNETLTSQGISLRTNLEAQQAANSRLLAENEDLKAANRKLQVALSDVTSKGDSLGKRYLDLKSEKEKLDDLTRSINSLRTSIVEESSESGTRFGKANIYLKDVLLGSLIWSVPERLGRDEAAMAEASFSAESIDYVRVDPDARYLLRSLGDKYKIRFDLASGSDSIKVSAGQETPVREIGEREHATWKWSVQNGGTKDSRLVLTASLINRDSNEIALLQQEPQLSSSNMVRQLRGYLQPVPLIAGIVLGFVLFGIVGIFRRPKKTIPEQRVPPSTPSEPVSHSHKKQL